MAVIDIAQFAGERPQVHKTKLPVYQAQIARNVVLQSGVLEPLRADKFIQPLSSAPGTIFKYRDSAAGPVWFEWNGLVDVVRSPVRSDPYGRVYIVGDGYPKVTDATRATGAAGPFPVATLRLGVPAPDAPTVVVNGSPSNPNDVGESRAYVVTYVNSYNEEGPPSAPSPVIVVRPGQYADVGLPGPPAGSYDITTIRVYRSNGTGASALFQFVTEVPVSTPSVTDTVSVLGEALPSAEWDPPPDDMVGLVGMPGGFLVGFRNNELIPSEVGLPHAYPVRYRFSVDSKIVGLGVFGNTLVILTDEQPLIATGTHPGSLTVTKTGVLQACVSRAGIVNLGYGVVYPSPEGLILVSSEGARLITEGIITRDQWQALSPDTLRASVWRGLYLAYYNNGGFVFNPRQPEAGFVFIDKPKMQVSRGYYDAEKDLTYLAIGSDLYEAGEGANRLYVWRSGQFDVGAYVYMGVVQVFADEYPVTVNLFGDDELLASLVVGDDVPRRFKRHRRARRYEVEVVSATTVYRVRCASTMAELKEVA
ncbi:hypothetical protein D6833_09340 [Candidatus Parcubacteria bacterium]|nr:MAG: hypothetical protein D6833_09340 [Candidatus Parcubacteria bacterium]